MKNKIKYTFTFFVFFIVFTLNIDAASLNISANKKSVAVGGIVKITVSGNGMAGMVNVSSSNGSVLSGGGTPWLENSSQTYNFSAKKLGSATITVKTIDAADSNGNPFETSKSITISVVKATSSTSQVVKSSVNTLDSLSVEGYKIIPDFDKETTSYNLLVDSDVQKIKIDAKATDEKAKVEGTGEKELKEEENKFSIDVTAEDGNKKTYEIIIKVDKNPIIIKIDNKEYSLVKQKEQLPELLLEHEDLTLSIEETDIPAYRIDKLNMILVGLKDSNGKVKLYRFNSFKDNTKPYEYKPFNLLTTKPMTIVYLDFPGKKIPNKYKKYQEKINNEEVIVYKLSKKSNFSIFYGINTATGKENIYKYDNKEQTMQIFEREEASLLENKIKDYMYVFIGLFSVCAFFLLIIVILLFTRRGYKKKVRAVYNKKLAKIKND